MRGTPPLRLIWFLLQATPSIIGADSSSPKRTRLDDFIQHHETLDYDPSLLQQQMKSSYTQAHHERVKRWLEPATRANAGDYSDDTLHLNFKSHGRAFNLRLKRDVDTFGEQVLLEVGNSTDVLRHHNLVEGYLEGEPDTRVHGSIDDGVFHGHIYTPGGAFSVERATRFWTNPGSSKNSSQHSVIYSHDDIENSAQGDHVDHYGCGVSDKTLAWMSSIQNSQIIEDDLLEQTHYFGSQETPTYAYRTNQSTIQRLIHNSQWGHHRGKRDAGDDDDDTGGKKSTRATTDSRTTCSLYIRTDPTVWREMVRQVIETPKIAEPRRKTALWFRKEETPDRDKIREAIIAIIGQHVKAVNDIFQEVVFKVGDKLLKNIRFEVQKIRIDTYAECENDYTGPENPFCEEHIDVSNYLDLHSRSNHEAYCLSYALAYRDFSGGVVGLAWVGSTTSGGGICQKYTKYLEGSSVKQRSLNTGIVTFLNYNRQLPPRLSQLTMAHEIGHNFGAPHDPDECQPGSPDGNFIMYSSSTNGYLKNNDKFSKCSIGSIVPVLNQVFNANSKEKENCFSETGGAFCGNSIVEEPEECDCGVEEDCTETCCYPRTTDRRRCTLRPHAACSPSEGPCCKAETCGFVSKDARLQCLRESECTERSVCDGSGAQCPLPMSKPDYTVCNNGTQVCLDGECRGSICLSWKMEECYLSSDDAANDKRTLCNVACKDPKTRQCKSTYDLSNVTGITPLSLRAGSPCDNFKGYCDVFLRCRAVDETGPLLRLKRLLFNRHNFRTLHQWAIEKWWVLVLANIGFLIFMALVIRCCAVHTPSSNPYRAKNLKFADTLRHPMNSLKRQPKRPRPGPDDAFAGYSEESREASYPLRSTK